jgi:hypothetical protein
MPSHTFTPGLTRRSAHHSTHRPEHEGGVVRRPFQSEREVRPVDHRRVRGHLHVRTRSSPWMPWLTRTAQYALYRRRNWPHHEGPSDLHSHGRHPADRSTYLGPSP